GSGRTITKGPVILYIFQTFRSAVEASESILAFIFLQLYLEVRIEFAFAIISTGNYYLFADLLLAWIEPIFIVHEYRQTYHIGAGLRKGMGNVFPESIR